jgi:hypothetical protein
MVGAGSTSGLVGDVNHPPTSLSQLNSDLHIGLITHYMRMSPIIGEQIRSVLHRESFNAPNIINEHLDNAVIAWTSCGALSLLGRAPPAPIRRHFVVPKSSRDGHTVHREVPMNPLKETLNIWNVFLRPQIQSVVVNHENKNRSALSGSILPLMEFLPAVSP